MVAFLLSLFLVPAAHAATLDDTVASSTVLIAIYDGEGKYVGRGSGFFVDEGIVITNIHVIEGAGRYYRVYAKGSDGAIDTNCYKDITRSDIKLNLEDDIAYLRAYVDCPHGEVTFGSRDPKIGDAVEVYGFPAMNGLNLVSAAGTVQGEMPAGLNGDLKGVWLTTDAKIHAGNSGGPIVRNGRVVGIAVAAHVDETHTSVDGIFIPVSQIIRGLTYANDASFGYTPNVSAEEEEEAPAPVSPAPASQTSETEKPVITVTPKPAITPKPAVTVKKPVVKKKKTARELAKERRLARLKKRRQQ